MSVKAFSSIENKSQAVRFRESLDALRGTIRDEEDIITHFQGLESNLKKLSDTTHKAYLFEKVRKAFHQLSDLRDAAAPNGRFS